MTDIKLFFLICSSLAYYWTPLLTFFVVALAIFTYKNGTKLCDCIMHILNLIYWATLSMMLQIYLCCIRVVVVVMELEFSNRVHKAKNDIRVTYKWKWFIKRCCLLTSCTFIIICFVWFRQRLNKIMLLKSLWFIYNKEFYHDIIIKIMIIYIINISFGWTGKVCCYYYFSDDDDDKNRVWVLSRYLINFILTRLRHELFKDN